MRPLSAAELLSTWERGLTGSPVERALLLLAAAHPSVTADDLARLPIGRRDRRLLELRAQTFGPRLASQADCPRCGERLEMAFEVGDLVAGSPPETMPPETIEEARAEAPAATFHLRRGGWEVEYRLPDSRDLGDLGRRAETPEAGRRRLLERCVLGARRRGRSVAATELPQRLVRALAEEMSAADPQAEVELALECPGCSHRWRAPFDVAAFFWTELDAWARRLLREVHLLARSYGWSEGEILALSPLRRRCYLEMVQA